MSTAIDAATTVPYAEYAKQRATNWSSLKLLDRSPAHYLHALTNPRADTDALKLGRAVHLAVLEPDRFETAHVLWDGGRRAGKEWQAFCLANGHREILKIEEFEHAQAISRAVHAHPEAHALLTGGAAEQSIQWTDARTGRRCKARLDYIGRTALVDLKSTRDASPDAFGRDAHKLGYTGQFAFYSDGYEAITGQRLPFRVVAVESAPPYVVQVYTVPEIVLECGREKYRELLDRLIECESRGIWPGYAEGEMELTLPRWAMGDSEEDIGGLDLVFGESSGFGESDAG